MPEETKSHSLDALVLRRTGWIEWQHCTLKLEDFIAVEVAGAGGIRTPRHQS